MITTDKVIEIFCIADDFCAEYDFFHKRGGRRNLDNVPSAVLYSYYNNVCISARGYARGEWRHLWRKRRKRS